MNSNSITISIFIIKIYLKPFVKISIISKILKIYYKLTEITITISNIHTS